MTNLRFRVEEISRKGQPRLKVSLPVRIRSYCSRALVDSCQTNRVFVIRRPELDTLELFQTLSRSGYEGGSSIGNLNLDAGSQEKIRDAKRKIIMVMEAIGASIN